MQFKKLQLSGFPHPSRKDFHNPQNFLASGDAHAVCSFPVAVSCLAADRECKCWDEDLTSWASRPRRVPAAKPAQSLSYLLLLSGGKSKADKSIPRPPADPWWAPGAGREAGQGGGGREGPHSKSGQDPQSQGMGPDRLPVPALPKQRQIIKPLCQPPAAAGPLEIS